jgi:hypothetical protein
MVCSVCDYAASQPRRSRKALHEQRRHHVQTVLSDVEYVALLEAAGVEPLSVWIREAILRRITPGTDESPLQSDKVA